MECAIFRQKKHNRYCVLPVFMWKLITTHLSEIWQYTILRFELLFWGFIEIRIKRYNDLILYMRISQTWSISRNTLGYCLHMSVFTLLNRLYGVWQCDLFTWYFRFQNTCNRNKFVWISRWTLGFYVTKSCKERHWTPFYPPNTLRGREYHFPVVRMFLREVSHKQCAETSEHKTTHPAVTKMTIVNFLVNVLQHNFNKQF